MMSIYEQLTSGIPAEEIAAAFTKQLNDAIDKVAAEQEAAEIAARENEKAVAADALAKELIDFVQEFYPETYTAELRANVTGEVLIQMFDETANEIVKMNEILSSLEGIAESLGIPKEKVNKKEKPAFDPIRSFLQANGLA